LDPVRTTRTNKLSSPHLLGSLSFHSFHPVQINAATPPVSFSVDQVVVVAFDGSLSWLAQAAEYLPHPPFFLSPLR
jgi:hypothetical protein